MTDIASLKIRVDSLEARLAEKDLGRLARTGDTAGVATAKLTGFMQGLVLPLLSAGTAMAALHKAISVQREFDILNAGLVTATGSTLGAAQAFSALQKFATETPYSLQQVTEAFTKLQNYGLDPSERALTSYGNTSAALGKDLMQMVEAVADAATGEFERLKEFGIRAHKQGDEIKFTFRGVTETVKNNAAEIEQYLIKLGENNFAGNMENRMKTLDGAIANLGDEVDKFFLNVMSSGFGEFIADNVRVAISGLEDLNDWLSSGELETLIKEVGAAWGPVAQDAQDALDIIWQALQDQNANFEANNPVLMEILTRAWREFPENMRAFVRIAVVNFAHDVEEIKIIARGLVDGVKAIFNSDTVAAAQARMDAAVAANNANLTDSIGLIMDERNATIKRTQAERAAGEVRKNMLRLKKEYEAQQKGDQLAGFRRERPDSPTAPSKDAARAAEAAERAAEAAQKARERDFQNLVASLRTEEEKIAESYAKRKAIIEANTAEGSDARSKLMGRLDAEHREEEEKLADSIARKADMARQGLMSDEQELAAHFARRREMVLADIADPTERDALLKKLQDEWQLRRDVMAQQNAQDRAAALMENEDRYAALAVQAQLQFDDRINRLRDALNRELITEEEFYDARLKAEEEFQRAKQQIAATMGEETFGALSEMAKAYAGEQSKSYKTLFAISKAFTIAKAAMDMQANISAAMAKGWPQNIGLIAMAIQQGAGILTAIRGINYSGAYDGGGFIPAGKWGIAGEFGPEVINGPARVTSRADTAKLLQGGKPMGDINLTSQYNIDASGGSSGGSQGDTERNVRELQNMIDNSAKSVIQREMRQGGIIWKMQHGAA